MANDVSIIVSAELGDTLIKLDLAKHAINDLGDASEETAAKEDAAAASTGFFTTALGEFNNMLGPSIPLLGGFSAPLAALPVIAVAAAASIVALVDAIGTLVAITADFVAPLSLVTGLLGLLGVGFLLAAKRAADGGGTLSEFSKKLDTLKSMFSKTTDILAHAFLPYLLKLADAGEKALLFIDKLASGSLTNAFRLMSTQGVQMLNQFFQAVANVIAHPIRIAFQLAFGGGKGGNEIASAVAGWWHQFSDYLFGYSNTHRLHIGRFLGPMQKTEVDGIFQPLIDWFNRHDFTKQGTKIGHEILRGLKPLAKPLGQFLVNVFEDGIKTAVTGMLQAFNPFSAGVKAKVRTLNDWIKEQLVTVATDAWNKIKQVAGDAITSIVDHLGNVKSAIQTVRDIASEFWGVLQKIAGFFSQVFTLNVNWPSPPGWLTSVIGGAGSIVSGAAGAVGGIIPHALGGGANVVQNNTFHLHGVSSDAAFRRHVRDIGRELGRQNLILAGGQ